MVARPDVFAVRPWGETDDPIASSPTLAGLGRDRSPSATAPGPASWSTCSARLPGHAFRARPAGVIGPLRAVKDAAEIDGPAPGRRGRRPGRRRSSRPARSRWSGRTEAEVSAELGRRLLEAGHHRVNFAIVAAGENAASPHHEPGAAGDRGRRGRAVRLRRHHARRRRRGYCSDITRCVVTGEPTAEVAEALRRAARGPGRRPSPPATVGTPCEDVDAAARRLITDAGYGERFVHRTGHGIGVEAHEDPYIVAGNASPLVAGHAFSVEPGIYLAGSLGLRLEDIVVATEHGPDALNQVPHGLVEL